MSLVNQVLRDLDRRHAAAGELGGLPQEVKPLPLPPRGDAVPWRGIAVAVVVVAVLVASGSAYRLLRPLPDAAPPAAPVIAPPPAAAIDAPLPAPVAALPSPPPAAAVPPSPTSAATRSAPPALAAKPAPQLKVASALSTLPAEAPAADTGVQKSAPGQGRQEGIAPGIEKSVRSTSPRERADAEYRRGLAQIARGRPAEAAADFKAALAEDASHAAVRQALARVLIDERRFDEAVQVLTEGLLRDERQPALALLLARIQTERGQAAAAAETLGRSQPAAGHADYRAFQGGVAQRLGRHKEAVEHYRAAVAQTPQSGVWWMGLGLALEAEGRAAEARDAFAQAAGSGSLSPELARFVEQKLR